MSERSYDAILADLDKSVDDTITRAESQKLYSDWADTYDREMEIFGARWMMLGAREFNAVMGDKKDAWILDFAAGTGLVGQELQKYGFTNMDALDMNEKMLEKARQKGIYKNLIRAQLGPDRLDIKDDTYDALLTTGTYFANHLDHTCLEELIRITKPGGLIVLLKLIPQKMKEYYPAFVDDFEPAIQRLEDKKLCKLIRRNDVEAMYKGTPAYAYVLQVIS